MGQPPRSCVAVEDSSTGVRAAVAAGFGHVLGVVNSGGDGTREALAKAGASLVFEKTVDAIEWCRMHYIRTEPVPAAAPKL